MAFTALTTTELATGQPVSTVTQNKIRTNFDDHETRIEFLEAGNTTDFPCITMACLGNYYVYGTRAGVCQVAVNFSLNITGVRLYINGAGSSGTTSIDILKKSGAGAWTSVLTTQPSVAYSAGNDSISTNGVINAAQQLVLAGDRLRLDLTGSQYAGNSFYVRIDYTHA